MKKHIFYLLLFFILLKLFFHLFENKSNFLRVYDHNYYGQLYSDSQYVRGPASKGGIGDDGLYAFAGYYYLIQGGDVSSVNFEHPPLGKYLIGLSILLFRNENIINIIYFLILLYFTYKLGFILLKNKTLALLSCGILSWDPIFLDNLLRSHLDLPLALFVTVAIYFFLVGLKNQKYYYLSMFFWGAAFSTRFFPMMVIIYLYLLVIVFFYARKTLVEFIKSSTLIPIVYFVSHISFFLYHPSIIEFLRHKKWMLAWFTGTPSIFGNIWRNIYTGTYLDSTRKLVIDEHWNMSISLVVTLAVMQFALFKLIKNNRELIILYGLSLVYLIYITVLTNGLNKFLMPIYPIICISAVGSLAYLYSIISPWIRPILMRLKRS